MPLKFKIYYWCSIYYLVFNAVLFIYLAYSTLTDYPSLQDVLLLIIPAVMLFKPIISIKTVTKLKERKGFKGDGAFFFTALFVLHIIYTLIACTVVYTFAVNWPRRENKLYAIAAFVSLLLFFIGAVYIALLDIPLKKIIQSYKYSEIDAIGKDITAQ